jgi:hypothetical protein
VTRSPRTETLTSRVVGRSASADDEHRRENRALSNEWNEDFQALWNADTVEGGLPPAPSPFEPEDPGGRQPEILESVARKAYVESGCGGGRGSVGTAR